MSLDAMDDLEQQIEALESECEDAKSEAERYGQLVQDAIEIFNNPDATDDDRQAWLNEADLEGFSILKAEAES